LQEAVDGVNDNLAWEVTLTFDLERGRLKPGIVTEPGGLENLRWVAWPQRSDPGTQAVLQERSLSWGG